MPDDLRAELEAATGASLGHVRIHDDDHANKVAASYGARAVTIGGNIFLAEDALEVSLEERRALLAHEVAHVVQSSGTTTQPSARGASGEGQAPAREPDAEAEADAFANKFLANGSNTRWRPRLPVASGAAMRKTAGEAVTATGAKPAEEKADVAWAYLRANEDRFIAAIEARLRLFAAPTDRRLGFVPYGISTQFRPALTYACDGSVLFIKLPELVHPGDPWYSIDQHRPLTEGEPGVVVDGREPKGALAWQFLAGEAVATDVQKALNASFARMVPRYLVQLEASPTVKLEDLVTSHPMDRLCAHLLTNPLVLKGVPSSKSHSKKQHGAKEEPGTQESFKDGLKFLQDWRWLGEKDPSLWNWLEVREPRDATPEDVAASLWLDPKASQYAYGITQSGPFFRLEPAWARKFVPDPLRKIDQPYEDNALALADSEFATEAAIGQASDAKRVDRKGKELPADFNELGRTLARSERQLKRMKDALPDALWELVLPALHWVPKQREWLAAMSDQRLRDLTPVIEGQSEVLFEAAGAVGEVAAMAAGKSFAEDPKNPIVNVMREYAVAAGESHLIDSAAAQLKRARSAKADLPLALMEVAARDANAGVDAFVAQGHGDWAGDYERKIDTNRRIISDMRRRRADGQAVDAGQVAVVAAEVKEQAVDVRCKALHNQLSDLANYARDSQFGFFETLASFFDSDVRALPGVISAAMDDLRVLVIDSHQRIKATELQAVSTEEARANVLQNVARGTEQRLTEFIERHDLKTRIGLAMGVIQRQERRTAIIQTITQIAILIGASVVGGMAGNLVAGVVRGAMVADVASASVGMLRATRVVGAVAGLTVDAGINAGVQLAVQGGGDPGEAFVGNFLGAAAVRVALAPLSRAAQAWGIAGEEARNVEKLNLWQKVGRGTKVAVYEGAVLTTSMITGAATEYVVHRIYHSKEPPTEKQALDWAIQGGSMAIGQFVGKWTHGFEQRLTQFAEHQGQLWARAQKMRRLASELTKTGDESLAIDLLVQRQEALREEARLLDELAAKMSHDPKSVNMSPDTIETLRVGNRAESKAVSDAAFDMVPLRLGGLAPDDSSGTIWTGHRAQIEVALDKSRRAGIDVEVIGHDQSSGQWKVRYNNKEITIVEIKQKSAVILAGHDAELAEAVSNIKPLPGYQDVALHGTVDDFEVIINGKPVSLDHRSLARYIEKNGGGKQKIRLLSCETGKHPKGAAQHLANKLGVEVIAPNDLLHVFEDGSMVIGPKPDRNTGSWETFRPEKASRRFTQAKDPQPERAVDRLHRSRSENVGETESKTLGDRDTTRPRVMSKSDLGDAAVRGEDYANRVGDEVGGHLEETIKQVALVSVHSEIQVEAGVRILDEAFGRRASDELKKGGRAVQRLSESPDKPAQVDAYQNLAETRREVEKSMLDTLRNPALPIAARKARLHQALDEYETAANGTSYVDHRQLGIPNARRAIDALRADTFDQMISVDAHGNLRQHGRDIGTLREFMTKVRETNAAYMRHGIEEELVISVSTPKDPNTPKEVKLLSRKPRRTSEQTEPGSVGKRRQQHAPVDPSDPLEEGSVVDVGVGLTDYAREVGGEQGEVVKTEYGGSYADPAMMRRDLTWKHTAPHLDADSVVMLGDALQTLPMMFPPKSVKRMFINNINAKYSPGSESYRNLARGLVEVMKSGGRVEVQWTTQMEETPGGLVPRGHITGSDLDEALAGAAMQANRRYSVSKADPIVDYDFSVEAPRPQSGRASKKPPSNPTPEFRWIITFGD